ncbi:MAG TPA: tetratricopeptide repeat protein [bacterium]|nr:tetratricopeptide repeat protein [bacterium]HPN95496.1 tetratricopeptide repeat protein [bacterium]
MTIKSIKSAGVKRLLDTGNRMLDMENYDEALVAFKNAYELDSSSSEAALCLAQELYMQGLTEESESVARKSLASEDNVEMLRLLTAIVLDDPARLDEAEEIIKRVRDDCGDEKTAALLEGHRLIEKCDGYTAYEMFKFALEVDPANEEALEGMSRALNLIGIEISEAGDNEAAVFMFKRAARLDPSWSAPYVNLGNCHSALERLDLARRCYVKGIDLEPDNPQAHFNLGRLMSECGEDDSAEIEFLASLDIDPDYPDANGELGRIYSIKGRFDLSVIHYEKELDANSDCPHCMCNLAVACLCDGDARRGEQLLRQSLEIEEDPFALYALAGLYASLDRETDSIQMLERAACQKPAWLFDSLRNDDKFERFRSDKRFIEIIEKLANNKS